MKTQQYLSQLSQHGFIPNTILDIGANTGEFANICKNIWNNSKIILFEANRECEKYLKNLPFEYHICLLGNEEKKVDFFVINSVECGTGNSIFRETSHYYNDDNCSILQVQMKKLNDILPPDNVDFIKMDTQGSELNILKGATNFLDKTQYILLETAQHEYNKGAPMEQEVESFLRDYMYYPVQRLDEFRYPDGKLFQTDVLYKKI